MWISKVGLHFPPAGREGISALKFGCQKFCKVADLGVGNKTWEGGLGRECPELRWGWRQEGSQCFLCMPFLLESGLLLTTLGVCNASLNGR